MGWVPARSSLPPMPRKGTELQSLGVLLIELGDIGLVTLAFLSQTQEPLVEHQTQPQWPLRKREPERWEESR